jgi:hypothetical protein
MRPSHSPRVRTASFREPDQNLSNFSLNNSFRAVSDLTDVLSKTLNVFTNEKVLESAQNNKSNESNKNEKKFSFFDQNNLPNDDNLNNFELYLLEDLLNSSNMVSINTGTSAKHLLFDPSKGIPNSVPKGAKKGGKEKSGKNIDQNNDSKNQQTLQNSPPLLPTSTPSTVVKPKILIQLIGNSFPYWLPYLPNWNALKKLSKKRLQFPTRNFENNEPEQNFKFQNCTEPITHTTSNIGLNEANVTTPVVNSAVEQISINNDQNNNNINTNKFNTTTYTSPSLKTTPLNPSLFFSPPLQSLKPLHSTPNDPQNTNFDQHTPQTSFLPLPTSIPPLTLSNPHSPDMQSIINSNLRFTEQLNESLNSTYCTLMTIDFFNIIIKYNKIIQDIILQGSQRLGSSFGPEFIRNGSQRDENNIIKYQNVSNIDQIGSIPLSNAPQLPLFDTFASEKSISLLLEPLLSLGNQNYPQNYPQNKQLPKLTSLPLMKITPTHLQNLSDEYLEDIIHSLYLLFIKLTKIYVFLLLISRFWALILSRANVNILTSSVLPPNHYLTLFFQTGKHFEEKCNDCQIESFKNIQQEQQQQQQQQTIEPKNDPDNIENNQNLAQKNIEQNIVLFNQDLCQFKGYSTNELLRPLRNELIVSLSFLTTPNVNNDENNHNNLHFDKNVLNFHQNNQINSTITLPYQSTHTVSNKYLLGELFSSVSTTVAQLGLKSTQNAQKSTQENNTQRNNTQDGTQKGQTNQTNQTNPQKNYSHQTPPRTPFLSIYHQISFLLCVASIHCLELHSLLMLTENNYNLRVSKNSKKFQNFKNYDNYGNDSPQYNQLNTTNMSRQQSNSSQFSSSSSSSLSSWGQNSSPDKNTPKNGPFSPQNSKSGNSSLNSGSMSTPALTGLSLLRNNGSFNEILNNYTKSISHIISTYLYAVLLSQLPHNRIPLHIKKVFSGGLMVETGKNFKTENRNEIFQEDSIFEQNYNQNNLRPFNPDLTSLLDLDDAPISDTLVNSDANIIHMTTSIQSNDDKNDDKNDEKNHFKKNDKKNKKVEKCEKVGRNEIVISPLALDQFENNISPDTQQPDIQNKKGEKEKGGKKNKKGDKPEKLSKKAQKENISKPSHDGADLDSNSHPILVTHPITHNNLPPILVDIPNINNTKTNFDIFDNPQHFEGNVKNSDDNSTDLTDLTDSNALSKIQIPVLDHQDTITLGDAITTISSSPLSNSINLKTVPSTSSGGDIPVLFGTNLNFNPNLNQNFEPKKVNNNNNNNINDFLITKNQFGVNNLLSSFDGDDFDYSTLLDGVPTPTSIRMVDLNNEKNQDSGQHKPHTIDNSLSYHSNAEIKLNELYFGNDSERTQNVQILSSFYSFPKKSQILFQTKISSHFVSLFLFYLPLSVTDRNQNQNQNNYHNGNNIALWGVNASSPTHFAQNNPQMALNPYQNQPTDTKQPNESDEFVNNTVNSPQFGSKELWFLTPIKEISSLLNGYSYQDVIGRSDDFMYTVQFSDLLTHLEELQAEQDLLEEKNEKKRLKKLAKKQDKMEKNLAENNQNDNETNETNERNNLSLEKGKNDIDNNANNVLRDDISTLEETNPKKKDKKGKKKKDKNKDKDKNQNKTEDLPAGLSNQLTPNSSHLYPLHDNTALSITSITPKNSKKSSKFNLEEKNNQIEKNDKDDKNDINLPNIPNSSTYQNTLQTHDTLSQFSSNNQLPSPGGVPRELFLSAKVLHLLFFLGSFHQTNLIIFLPMLLLTPIYYNIDLMYVGLIILMLLFGSFIGKLILPLFSYMVCWLICILPLYIQILWYDVLSLVKWDNNNGFVLLDEDEDGWDEFDGENPNSNNFPQHNNNNNNNNNNNGKNMPFSPQLFTSTNYNSEVVPLLLDRSYSHGPTIDKGYSNSNNNNNSFSSGLNDNFGQEIYDKRNNNRAKNPNFSQNSNYSTFSTSSRNNTNPQINPRDRLLSQLKRNHPLYDPIELKTDKIYSILLTMSSFLGSSFLFFSTPQQPAYIILSAICYGITTNVHGFIRNSIIYDLPITKRANWINRFNLIKFFTFFSTFFIVLILLISNVKINTLLDHTNMYVSFDDLVGGDNHNHNSNNDTNMVNTSAELLGDNNLGHNFGTNFVANLSNPHEKLKQKVLIKNNQTDYENSFDHNHTSLPPIPIPTPTDVNIPTPKQQKEIQLALASILPDFGLRSLIRAGINNSGDGNTLNQQQNGINSDEKNNNIDGNQNNNILQKKDKNGKKIRTIPVSQDALRSVSSIDSGDYIGIVETADDEIYYEQTDNTNDNNTNGSYNLDNLDNSVNDNDNVEQELQNELANGSNDEKKSQNDLQNDQTQNTAQKMNPYPAPNQYDSYQNDDNGGGDNDNDNDDDFLSNITIDLSLPHISFFFSICWLVLLIFFFFTHYTTPVFSKNWTDDPYLRYSKICLIQSLMNQKNAKLAADKKDKHNEKNNEKNRRSSHSDQTQSYDNHMEQNRLQQSLFGMSYQHNDININNLNCNQNAPQNSNLDQNNNNSNHSHNSNLGPISPSDRITSLLNHGAISPDTAYQLQLHGFLGKHEKIEDFSLNNNNQNNYQNNYLRFNPLNTPYNEPLRNNNNDALLLQPLFPNGFMDTQSNAPHINVQNFNQNSQNAQFINQNYTNYLPHDSSNSQIIIPLIPAPKHISHTYSLFTLNLINFLANFTFILSIIFFAIFLALFYSYSFLYSFLLIGVFILLTQLNALFVLPGLLSLQFLFKNEDNYDENNFDSNFPNFGQNLNTNNTNNTNTSPYPNPKIPPQNNNNHTDKRRNFCGKFFAKTFSHFTTTNLLLFFAFMSIMVLATFLYSLNNDVFHGQQLLVEQWCPNDHLLERTNNSKKNHSNNQNDKTKLRPNIPTTDITSGLITTPIQSVNKYNTSPKTAIDSDDIYKNHNHQYTLIFIANTHYIPPTDDSIEKYKNGYTNNISNQFEGDEFDNNTSIAIFSNPIISSFICQPGHLITSIRLIPLFGEYKNLFLILFVLFSISLTSLSKISTMLIVQFDHITELRDHNDGDDNGDGDGYNDDDSVDNDHNDNNFGGNFVTKRNNHHSTNSNSNEIHLYNSLSDHSSSSSSSSSSFMLSHNPDYSSVTINTNQKNNPKNKQKNQSYLIQRIKDYFKLQILPEIILDKKNKKKFGKNTFFKTINTNGFHHSHHFFFMTRKLSHKVSNNDDNDDNDDKSDKNDKNDTTSNSISSNSSSSSNKKKGLIGPQLNTQNNKTTNNNTKNNNNNTKKLFNIKIIHYFKLLNFFQQIILPLLISLILFLFVYNLHIPHGNNIINAFENQQHGIINGNNQNQNKKELKIDKIDKKLQKQFDENQLNNNNNSNSNNSSAPLDPLSSIIMAIMLRTLPPIQPLINNNNNNNNNKPPSSLNFAPLDAEVLQTDMDQIQTVNNQNNPLNNDLQKNNNGFIQLLPHVRFMSLQVFITMLLCIWIIIPLLILLGFNHLDFSPVYSSIVRH